jgi:hypothetical protein
MEIYIRGYQRFDAFTVLNIQFEVFWVVTPYSVVVEYQRFEGQWCLHLQGEVPENRGRGDR